MVIEIRYLYLLSAINNPSRFNKQMFSIKYNIFQCHSPYSNQFYFIGANSQKIKHTEQIIYFKVYLKMLILTVVNEN